MDINSNEMNSKLHRGLISEDLVRIYYLDIMHGLAIFYGNATLHFNV